MIHVMRKWQQTWHSRMFSFSKTNKEVTYQTPWLYRVIRKVFTLVTNIYWRILIIKPTRCTNFSNLFWNETLHVSDSLSAHHQEFFTVHSAMVYVIQFCWQLASRIRMFHVWHIPLLSVQWKTPDDGQTNCPKHVEFNSKINLRN
jgi:hypothetical protein